MDSSKAEEHFNFMLNVIIIINQLTTLTSDHFIDFWFDFWQEEDISNGNAMTSDRFKDLVYDFWISHDPER